MLSAESKEVMELSSLNVAVLGTGYVGLTTGVALAYLGCEVACIDIDEGKIEKLKSVGPARRARTFKRWLAQPALPR